MSPAPWRLLVSGSPAALLLPSAAAAQPALGRFAGNSRDWRLDDVGTDGHR